MLTGELSCELGAWFSHTFSWKHPKIEFQMSGLSTHLRIYSILSHLNPLSPGILELGDDFNQFDLIPKSKPFNAVQPAFLFLSRMVYVYIFVGVFLLFYSSVWGSFPCYLLHLGSRISHLHARLAFGFLALASLGFWLLASFGFGFNCLLAFGRWLHLAFGCCWLLVLASHGFCT